MWLFDYYQLEILRNSRASGKTRIESHQFEIYTTYSWPTSIVQDGSGTTQVKSPLVAIRNQILSLKRSAPGEGVDMDASNIKGWHSQSKECTGIVFLVLLFGTTTGIMPPSPKASTRGTGTEQLELENLEVRKTVP